MKKIRETLKKITPLGVLLSLVGSAILAFGLFNVHSFSGVTEGGTLGLTLFFDHWFKISPAVTGFVLNLACYILGIASLGGEFLVYSLISSVGFSATYSVFEAIGPLFPQIGEYPIVAAIVGAIFVGVGVGLCVRVGGAPTGDDALAMTLSHLTGVGIRRVYLASDMTVLALSLTYIPLTKIWYSFVTVVLSGQIIGWIEKIGKSKETIK